MKKEKLNRLNFKELGQFTYTSVLGGQSQKPSEAGYRKYETCENCGDSYTVYYLDGSIHRTEFEPYPCEVNGNGPKLFVELK